LRYTWLKVLFLERASKKTKEDKVQTNCNGKLYLSRGDIVTLKGKCYFFFVGDEQRMMLMGLRRFTKYTNMPNIGLRETITKISVRK
jgi:hypothetical protein